MKWIYTALFWIPFAFAAFLCGMVLNGRDTALPAFYSFLPMTFFFIGVAFMELIRRIRILESRPGDPGGDNEGATHRQRSFPGEQTNLFSAPVDWAAGIVRTPARFTFAGVMFTAFIGLIIYEASNSGWRAALGIGIFLAAYQLMMLYALRRLYFQLIPPEN